MHWLPYRRIERETPHRYSGRPGSLLEIESSGFVAGFRHVPDASQVLGHLPGRAIAFATTATLCSLVPIPEPEGNHREQRLAVCIKDRNSERTRTLYTLSNREGVASLANVSEFRLQG